MRHLTHQLNDVYQKNTLAITVKTHKVVSIYMKIQLLPMNKKFCYLAFLCLIACAGQPVKTKQTLDFSSPGQIELEIQADDSSVQTESLNLSVGNNLREWDYPVAVNNQSTSHLLKASVGKLTRGSTPTGLSFSAGNSDPRALDFQKMDVLPISCQLQSKVHPEQAGELSMDFMADKEDKEYLSADQLADHISTVCYNLLTGVKWPLKAKPEENGKKKLNAPEWMPEIRIEDKVTTEDPINSIPPTPAPIAKEAAKPDNDAGAEPKIEIKNDEPRRQIIIHNQGAPVILDFGYQRR
jgi:hypothetical protein